MTDVLLDTLMVALFVAPGIAYYRRKWAREDKEWTEQDRIAAEGHAEWKRREALRQQACWD